MPAREYPDPATVYRLRSEAEAAQPIPNGYCQCGCGERTKLAPGTDSRRGWVKGQPLKYLLGHTRRSAATHRIEDCGHTTPCWTWLGALKDGYARTTTAKRRTMLVHRLVYEQSRAPLAEELTLDHLCRNRACINPDHLQPVTRAENSRRGSNSVLGWHGATLVRLLWLTTTLDHAEIAEMLGVGRSTVGLVLSGKTWATSSLAAAGATTR